MPQWASHLRRIESCQVEKTARDFPVPSCSAACKRRRKKAPRSFRNIRCRRLGAWRSLKSSLFKQIPRPIAPYRRPVAKHPIFFRRERVAAMPLHTFGETKVARSRWSGTSPPSNKGNCSALRGGFFLQCGKKNQKRSAPCLPRVGLAPGKIRSLARTGEEGTGKSSADFSTGQDSVFRMWETLCAVRPDSIPS